jgi:hypothetical protein
MKSCLGVIGFTIVFLIFFAFIEWLAEATAWFMGPLVLVGVMVFCIAQIVREYKNWGK